MALSHSGHIDQIPGISATRGARDRGTIDGPRRVGQIAQSRALRSQHAAVRSWPSPSTRRMPPDPPLRLALLHGNRRPSPIEDLRLPAQRLTGLSCICTTNSGGTRSSGLELRRAASTARRPRHRTQELDADTLEERSSGNHDRCPWYPPWRQLRCDVWGMAEPYRVCGCATGGRISLCPPRPFLSSASAATDCPSSSPAAGLEHHIGLARIWSEAKDQTSVANRAGPRRCRPASRAAILGVTSTSPLLYSSSDVAAAGTKARRLPRRLFSTVRAPAQSGPRCREPARTTCRGRRGQAPGTRRSWPRPARRRARPAGRRAARAAHRQRDRNAGRLRRPSPIASATLPLHVRIHPLHHPHFVRLSLLSQGDWGKKKNDGHIIT